MICSLLARRMHLELGHIFFYNARTRLRTEFRATKRSQKILSVPHIEPLIHRIFILFYIDVFSKDFQMFCSTQNVPQDHTKGPFSSLMAVF